jgi:hypothetical protein
MEEEGTHKIHLEKINNHVITPVLTPLETRKVKGSSVCFDCYANIALIGKKKSGKTNVLIKFLKEKISKKTNVVLFSSTLNKDPKMKHIKTYCEKNAMSFEGYTSIMEDGVNQLEEIMNDINDDAEIEEEEKQKGGGVPEVDLGHLLEQMRGGGHKLIRDGVKAKKKRKPKKPKKLAPEWMFIFDDISTELKNPSLIRLLKINRHLKSSVIISSQWVHDLPPQSLKQLDILIIFKGQSEKKLRKLYVDVDISIPFELFEQLYHNATQIEGQKRWNFLYIDVRNDQFRKNLNLQYTNLPEN